MPTKSTSSASIISVAATVVAITRLAVWPSPVGAIAAFVPTFPDEQPIVTSNKEAAAAALIHLFILVSLLSFNFKARILFSI
ncbi:hypothetical protein D3C71_1937720 [compost metagenome]